LSKRSTTITILTKYPFELLLIHSLQHENHNENTHAHGHSHSHGHQHDHGQEDHGHSHAHSHSHSHEHGHSHSHEHGHSHSHSQDHVEEHTHSHAVIETETKDPLERWENIFRKHDPPLTEVKVLVGDLKQYFEDLTVTWTPWLFIFVARGLEGTELGKKIMCQFMEMEIRKIARDEIVAVGAKIVAKRK
jgi:hypothetical protein